MNKSVYMEVCMALIGQVASTLNVSQSSLKRWEREVIIPKIPRRPTGFRDYREEHKAIIKSIDMATDTFNLGLMQGRAITLSWILAETDVLY